MSKLGNYTLTIVVVYWLWCGSQARLWFLLHIYTKQIRTYCDSKEICLYMHSSCPFNTCDQCGMICWFIKNWPIISGIFEKCSTSTWSYKMIGYSQTKPFQFLLMTKKLLVSQVQVSLPTKRYRLQSAFRLYWLCIWVTFTCFTTKIEDQFTKNDNFLVVLLLRYGFGGGGVCLIC